MLELVGLARKKEKEVEVWVDGLDEAQVALTRAEKAVRGQVRH
jgi:hypothetical protein